MNIFASNKTARLICLFLFSCSSLAASDHGFEAGDFAAWPIDTFGTTVSDIDPYSGSFHGLLSCTYSGPEAPLIDSETGNTTRVAGG